MKTVPQKTTNDRKTGFLPPPIPLQRSESKTLQKDDYLSMKLRSIPNKSTSPVYELNVPYFKSEGTPEEWLKFLNNFKKVIIGQDLSTGATRLLTGEALTQFNKKAKDLLGEKIKDAGEGEVLTTEDVETVENITTCF